MVDTNDVLLRLEHINKNYAGEARPIEVLRDISLDIHAGEMVAILGKSGSGKSTLLRIMCGLGRPSSGQVIYRSHPVNKPMPGIAMVFQTFALFPWLTVQQNVELGLEAQGVAREERQERALGMIDMIGLGGFESAYPKELSGGMRQRVGFARALAVHPDILLMDEAFSALDVTTSEGLRNDLMDLWSRHAIPTQAIIMVSHNIEESVLMSDRIIIFDSNPGRIKTDIPVTLKRPRDREAPEVRHLIDRIYSVMTSVAPSTGTRAQPFVGLDQRLPEALSIQLIDLLEEISREEEPTGVELSSLAEDLHMEIDDLFPIVDSLTLLGLAQVTQGKIRLSALGASFVKADDLARKRIFAAQLQKQVALARRIIQVIATSPSHSTSREQFLDELEEYFTPDEADRVLSIMIDWGRYAELFSYDYNSGILSEPTEDEATE
jgi:NitT/TauT family transport system ATP-binding protein